MVQEDREKRTAKSENNQTEWEIGTSTIVALVIIAMVIIGLHKKFKMSTHKHIPKSSENNSIMYSIEEIPNFDEQSIRTKVNYLFDAYAEDHLDTVRNLKHLMTQRQVMTISFV